MNRRSLKQAISIQDPEIAGFLKAGVPKPLESKGASPDLGQRNELSVSTPSNDAADSPPQERIEGPEGVGSAGPPHQMIMESGGAIPVTFRLPEKIVRAMISASADRKIKRIKPFTQQSIATEAIEEWLKGKGYL